MEINKAYFVHQFSGGTSIAFSDFSGPNDSGEWDTYEEALEVGIFEALQLIKDETNNIIEVRISELYEQFLNSESIKILDYNLNKIQIIEFEYIKKSAFKDTTTFLKLELSQHQLFVPYSESAILIRGMLSI